MPLHLQSCVDGMSAMPEGSCALAIADPPYNIGVKKASWDSMPLDDYIVFSEAWLRAAFHVLKEGGTLLIWGSPNNTMLARITLLATEKIGFQYEQSMCWVYTQGGDGRLQTMAHYATRHEVLLWFVKPGKGGERVPHTFNAAEIATPYTDEERAIARSKGSNRLREDSLKIGRPPRSWFEFARENSRSQERRFGSHPSMKPLPLCKHLILAHSNPSDSVVIPFAGSGSEYISALIEGRAVTAFEIDPTYLSIAQKRARSKGVAEEGPSGSAAEGPSASAAEGPSAEEARRPDKRPRRASRASAPSGHAVGEVEP